MYVLALPANRTYASERYSFGEDLVCFTQILWVHIYYGSHDQSKALLLIKNLSSPKIKKINKERKSERELEPCIALQTAHIGK